MNSWIDKGIIENYPHKGINRYHFLICPKCNSIHRAKELDTGEIINANFCPNCGEKMKVEE